MTVLNPNLRDALRDALGDAAPESRFSSSAWALSWPTGGRAPGHAGIQPHCRPQKTRRGNIRPYL